MAASWTPSPHPRIHKYFWKNQSSEWGYKTFCKDLEKKNEPLDRPHQVWISSLKEIRASDWTPKDISEYCKDLQEGSNNDSDSSTEDPDFQNKRNMANSGESSKKGRFLTRCELDLDEDCLALVRTPWDELEEEEEEEEEHRTHDMVTRSVSLGKQSVTKEVASVSWMIIDIVTVDIFNDKNIKNEVRKKLQAAVDSCGLANDLSGEILQAANVFQSVSSKETLSECISEFFPKMFRGMAADSFSKDLEYIWRVNFH
ncbi:hypothetical protein BGZ65_007967, partial [Modicella reniformis]